MNLRQGDREYRNAFVEMVEKLKPEYAITLTWDPARRRSASKDFLVIEDQISVGMCVLARAIGGHQWQRRNPPTIAYFGVLERGRAGEVHAHLGVTLNPRLTARARAKFSGWWAQRHGHAHFEKTFDIRGFAKYIAKDVGPCSHYFLSRDLGVR